jgi:hypothetical protein
MPLHSPVFEDDFEGTSLDPGRVDGDVRGA